MLEPQQGRLSSRILWNLLAMNFQELTGWSGKPAAASADGILSSSSMRKGSRLRRAPVPRVRQMRTPAPSIIFCPRTICERRAGGWEAPGGARKQPVSTGGGKGPTGARRSCSALHVSARAHAAEEQQANPPRRCLTCLMGRTADMAGRGWSDAVVAGCGAVFLARAGWVRRPAAARIAGQWSCSRHAHGSQGFREPPHSPITVIKTAQARSNACAQEASFPIVLERPGPQLYSRLISGVVRQYAVWLTQ